MAYEIKVALFSDDKICPCELSFCTSVYEIEVALFSAEWSTAFEKKSCSLFSWVKCAIRNKSCSFFSWEKCPI